jgi:hypothetical protein
LAVLLHEQRGARKQGYLPPVSVKHILSWADRYHQRTGKWPTTGSGLIPEAPEETWNGVHMALVQGQRGLRRGSSLAGLLDHDRRGGARMRQPR